MEVFRRRLLPFLHVRGLSDLVVSYVTITFQELLRRKCEEKFKWEYEDRVWRVFNECSAQVVESSEGLKLQITIKKNYGYECVVDNDMFYSVKHQIRSLSYVLETLANENAVEALKKFGLIGQSNNMINRGVFEFLKSVPETTLLSLFYGLLDVAPAGRFVRYLPESDDE